MPSRGSYGEDEDQEEGRSGGGSRGRSSYRGSSSQGGRSSQRGSSSGRYEEDYPRSRRSSGRHSEYDEGEEGEEYGSSRHGRTRHEPVEVERENRSRGARKGWGESPDAEESYSSSRRGGYSGSSRGEQERGGYEQEDSRSRRRSSW